VWQQGHEPTDYANWKKATAPYQIKWQRNFEPYLLLHATAPAFDEQFSGFGWNKVSHVMQLAAAKYTFQVLPLAYIVHQPHGSSLDLSRFRQDKSYRECVKKIKSDFEQRLKQQYGRW